MDELLRIVTNQGPFGLAAALFAFLWWNAQRRYDALQHDYMEHLADDIAQIRGLKA